MSGASDVNISTETRDGATIVRPEGDIDLTASPSLRNVLADVLSNLEGKLVVDLSDVEYMDSSGVATLVEALQISRKNDTPMVLAGLSDRVQSIFQIARLHTVFDIASSVEEAVG